MSFVGGDGKGLCQADPSVLWAVSLGLAVHFSPFVLSSAALLDNYLRYMCCSIAVARFFLYFLNIFLGLSSTETEAQRQGQIKTLFCGGDKTFLFFLMCRCFLF